MRSRRERPGAGGGAPAATSAGPRAPAARRGDAASDGRARGRGRGSAGGAPARARPLVAALVLAALASVAAAEPAKEPPKGGALFDAGSFGSKKEPIVVTSDTLEYDYKTNVVVYRGDVIAVQADTKVRSDTLTVTLAAQKDSDPPDTAKKGDQRLQAECRTKSYAGRRVVNEVSIEVHAGEVVGLLGPNGAGKTTTFYMIVGLTRPDTGQVNLNGEDLTRLPMYERARRGISYLPQEPSVFRKLTVEQNVLAILETLDLTSAARAERLQQLLAELGIARLAKSKALSLSGGERRRVEITRALVISPAFMLLDEPFAGIEPIAGLDMPGIVDPLRQRGIGVLITDHNVRETLGICDRAYILNDGAVLEEGAPARIAASPLAREIYLGEKFRL